MSNRAVNQQRPFGGGLCDDAEVTSSVAILERPVYSVAEASRLLRVPPSTLTYWLDGGRFGRKTYRPVIRPEATGDRTVTWAEFVEASLLRRYRRDHGVPLPELRDFIDVLRLKFDARYPLTQERPFVAGRQLVVAAQEESDLPEELWLVAPAKNQPLLLAPADAHLRSITFKDGAAARLNPTDDPASPVVIDPAVRFGKPSVRGVSTEVIWEHSNDGYAADEIAEQFDLDRKDVERSLAYEYASHAA